VGKDRIYAVASTAPLDIFSGDFDQTGFMTLTRKSGSQGRVRGIGVKMEQAKLDAAQELVIRITP